MDGGVYVSIYILYINYISMKKQNGQFNLNLWRHTLGLINVVAVPHGFVNMYPVGMAMLP